MKHAITPNSQSTSLEKLGASRDDGLAKHIILIGFMGCGKSTIGKLLGEKLNMPFIDMDDYIEEKEGNSIMEIFEEFGEEYFRKLEHKSLRELLGRTQISIISTGGGTPCFFDNMKLIHEQGISFYIKVGRITLAHRLLKDTERPLIQNKTWKELSSFVDLKLREREDFYLRANHKIRGSKSPEAIVERIIRIINQD